LDYKRPIVRQTAGASVHFAIDKQLTDSLVALCQREATTLFVLLLTAFKLLLYRYSGQEDCRATQVSGHC